MGISVVVNEDNYEKIKLEAHKNRRTIGNELAMIRLHYRDWETDRKSTRLNSSHRSLSRMPSSA